MNIIIKGSKAEQRKREFIRHAYSAVKRTPIEYDEHIEDFKGTFPRKPAVEQVKFIDKCGREIRPNSFIKNKMWHEAKQLREEIRDGMCTKTECWRPDERNVNKMIRREFPLKDKVERYKKFMRALGPDEKDLNTERLRRGR